MKFKIDENLPVEVSELLQQKGHDAVTVLDQQLGGKVDSEKAELLCHWIWILQIFELIPQTAFPALLF